VNQCIGRGLFSETTLTGCTQYAISGVFYWMAGQRINPHRNTTFIWRVTSNETHNERVSTMTYTNWKSPQPDFAGQRESCMHLSSGYAYTWNDKDCSDEMCFVCELDI